MKTITLLLIGLTLLVSCTPEDLGDNTNGEQPIITQGPAIHFEGVIKWNGSPEADGRGWSFVPAQTNNHYYLKNLPASFQQDNLQVAISLKQTTEKARCFCPDPPYLYAVIAIEKK
jgi:hypothetical protein